MSLWLPSSNKFYIPQSPVSRILNTEEYVTRTTQFYYAGTERLLTVGHPQYEITDRAGAISVPKVSPLQYRAFRFRFPDPNQFVFSEPGFYDPENERLVWALVGMEINRGQPLGVAVSGNPYFNRLDDVESPNKAPGDPAKDQDNRVNLGFDSKQQQVIIVGCRPAGGEHWGAALPCADKVVERQDKCPALEIKTSYIQDGDMMDTGLGNMDFKLLQASKSDAPLEISQTTCKSPDMIRMAQELYGDMCFFCVRYEQVFLRHFFSKAGKLDEPVPDDLVFGNEESRPSNNYMGAPSGSLVSTSNQLFNKPYWIRKTQGHNNGIMWHNQLFVTVGDTTRGTVFNITVENKREDKYKGSNFNSYLRHVQEFQLSFILQACIVKLTPDTVAHIYQMDKTILEEWNLGVANNTVNGPIPETYRFIESDATKCPDAVKKDKPKDPYENLKFWDVNLTDRLSQDLSHFPLGRKFLYTGRYNQAPRPIKRKANDTNGTSVKRRRQPRK